MLINVHNSQQRLRVKKNHRVLPEREQNIPLQNISLILGGWLFYEIAEKGEVLKTVTLTFHKRYLHL